MGSQSPSGEYVPTVLGQLPRVTSGVPAAATPVPPSLSNHARYRVIGPLGQGGMGAVFLAEHIKMERRVALKVINSALLGDETHLQRFHQEVRAASKLSHPNIVTAFDADDAGDGAEKAHFLVMEYIEGETLHDYINRMGPLPVGEACNYAMQAALGLQHAYENGMVHRDIKPQNLLLSSKHEIKILDFGLARLERMYDDDEQAISQLTQSGTLMGTVDYMAPEQANDSHSVDARADIYSLGCTLYQMLAGKVPFPDGSVTARLVKHATAEPKPLHDIRAEIPLEVEDIVNRMLAKKPEDRFCEPGGGRGGTGALRGQTDGIGERRGCGCDARSAAQFGCAGESECCGDGCRIAI